MTSELRNRREDVMLGQLPEQDSRNRVARFLVELSLLSRKHGIIVHGTLFGNPAYLGTVKGDARESGCYLPGSALPSSTTENVLEWLALEWLDWQEDWSQEELGSFWAETISEVYPATHAAWRELQAREKEEE